MEHGLYIFYASFITTVVWSVAGGILYMNPVVAKIYKKHKSHPSFKIWSSQTKYLAGAFIVAGFIPILLIAIAYSFISPISIIAFGLILSGVRIIPRFCDAWSQTSYPNPILAIELVNGCILSFVIAYMLSIV